MGSRSKVSSDLFRLVALSHNHYKKRINKMTMKETLHILRNPYGFSSSSIREAACAAADTIDKLSGQTKETSKIIKEWGKSYQELLDWAEESGLDVITYNR
jgi:hypothetical protein